MDEDPAEEQISHSEEDHGFGDAEALLVIADQPALCISYDPSLHVDEGSALGCWAEGEVKANEAIDCAATHTMPSAAGDGDDAKRGEWTTLIISDREDDMTRA